MKIHADKIENGPPHVLSVRDVRVILKSVPRDWTKGIKEVRIANSMDYYSRTFFSRYDGCLTICSRNKTKAKALAAVLSELAAISMAFDRGLRYRPKAVRDRLNAKTAPYMQRLLLLIDPLIDPKGKVRIAPWPARPDVHISLEGFRELRFPFVPNDPESE